MQFTMKNDQLKFENEVATTTMKIINKNPGHLGRKGRLRCYTHTYVFLKETQREVYLNLAFYWNCDSSKVHVIFTGTSLTSFIKSNDMDWKEFKRKHWDQVKELATRVFTEKEITEYKQSMEDEA